MDLPVPVNVAVVAVGTDDAALRIVVDRLGALGHRLLEVQHKASGDPLLELLSSWIDNPDIDVVLAVASDTDPVRAAVAPLVTRSLPGFGELLRIAAFGEIGSAAMTLDAEAARCGSKYVFVIPGTVGAVKVALERLLIPQLDLRTRPSSLAAKLPRLRKMAPAAAEAFANRGQTEPGTGVEPRPAAEAAPAVAVPAEAARVETAPAEAAPEKPIVSEKSAPSRTVPPNPPPRSTKTPPMGVVLRAPAKDSGEIPMLNSDAAIPIQPAVIVDDEATARPRSTTLEVDKDAIKSEEPVPAIALPRTTTDELDEKQIVDEPIAKADEPAAKTADAAPATSEPLTADNVGAFVRSLEQHAKEVREKSQVGPLPRRPKTEPPPMPKKTDAELKAARDAAVTEAISHVGRRPEAPKPAAPVEEEPAPPPKRKNTTTQAEWQKAQEEIQRISSKPPEPTLAELDKRAGGTKVSKKRRGALIVPLLLGVAAAGGYVIKTQLASNGTASAEPQPQPQVAEVAPPAPQQPAPPQQPVVAEEPEIVVDLTNTPVGSGSAQGSAQVAPNLTAVAQAHHHTGSAAPHETGSAGSDTGSDGPADPRTHPNIAPESADCDEASCILEKYARECCARYKPAEMPVDKVDPVKPAGPPETLDKAAVKAGIADVKPAVQQCGEEHYKSGTVKITLTVSADGAVTDATVADSPDPELGKCVAAALRRASFARTQNGAVFTYPFAF